MRRTHAHGPRERGERAHRGGAIERQRAAREGLPRDRPHGDERIGDRGRSTAAVARGSGIGARALGPHLQHAAGIDARDRAAARADRVHVERRTQHGHAGDLAGAASRQAIAAGVPSAEERAIGRGAADIERERAREAARARGRERGAQSRGRPRQQLPHGLMRSLRDGRGAAVRQHDLEFGLRTGRSHLREIARDARRQERVGGRRGEALVLADLGHERTRGRDGHAEARERSRQRPLVRRVRPRVQQSDGDRLGSRGAHATYEVGDRTRREQPLDRPPGAQALRDAEAARARHERRRAPRLQRVQIGTILPPDSRARPRSPRWSRT
jgi:hypothetical protein